MANVKHTTNNGEILTTNCKRVATALKRFAEFLGSYDRCYNVMLNNIKSANDNNTTTYTDDSYNTITMTLTVSDNNDNYTLTIKHTHNAPKTIWSICNQDGNIKDFTDRKELFEYAYKNNLYGNFETIWIEEKELKDERFDYYETVDYEELDLYKIRTMLEFDICDMKVNTNATEYTLDNIKDRYAIKDDATDKCHYVYTKTWCKDDKKRVYIKDYKNRSIGYIDAVNGDIKINDRQGIYADELDYALINIIADMTKNHVTDSKDDNKETSTNNKTQQTCHIKAYYDGKEITIPYNDYKCRKYAVEYIHNLFKERVVPYETIFTLHYNTTAETITILTVIPTTDLIQYNIDDINDGLKNDCYKKVREGFERLCDVITGTMKICIDLSDGNNTPYCTIKKSRYNCHYQFKFVKCSYMKKPSDFARWLYFKTFVRSIELKCWYFDYKR